MNHDSHKIIPEKYQAGLTLTAHNCSILDVPADTLILSTGLIHPHKKTDLLSKVMKEMDTSTFRYVTELVNSQRADYIKKYALPPIGNWTPESEYWHEPEYCEEDGAFNSYDREGRLDSKNIIIDAGPKLAEKGYKKIWLTFYDTGLPLSGVVTPLLFMTDVLGFSDRLPIDGGVVMPLIGFTKTPDKKEYLDELKRAISFVAKGCSCVDLHIPIPRKDTYERFIEEMKPHESYEINPIEADLVNIDVFATSISPNQRVTPPDPDNPEEY